MSTTGYIILRVGVGVRVLIIDRVRSELLTLVFSLLFSMFTQTLTTLDLRQAKVGRRALEYLGDASKINQVHPAVSSRRDNSLVIPFLGDTR